MSTTIKEIAQMANVSRGTVDKVLNNRPGVKKETRERVNRIIQELNYRPNIIGKALVQSSRPYKIKIILTPDYNPYIQETIKGIQQGIAEFAPFGIEVNTSVLESLDPSEQMDLLSELDLSSCSGLAIFPLNTPSIIQKINELSDIGLPVITFNSYIPDLHVFCHIGQDHYHSGRVAAGLLGKQIPSAGKIGIISSSSALSCHSERLKGFHEKLTEAYPSMKIVEIQENQDRDEKAYQLSLKYFRQYPDLNGIYISGGGVGGIGKALKETGKNTQIRVVCHDVTPDSKDLLKKGLIDFVLSQSSIDQGYQIVKTFFEYFFRKQLPASHFIAMPIQILTDELI